MPVHSRADRAVFFADSAVRAASKFQHCTRARSARTRHRARKQRLYRSRARLFVSLPSPLRRSVIHPEATARASRATMKTGRPCSRANELGRERLVLHTRNRSTPLQASLDQVAVPRPILRLLHLQLLSAMPPELLHLRCLKLPRTQLRRLQLPPRVALASAPLAPSSSMTTPPTTVLLLRLGSLRLASRNMIANSWSRVKC